MTELHPTYYIYWFEPISFQKMDDPLRLRDNKLVFQCQPVDIGWYTYVCMSGVAVYGREEDCSTPPFQPTEINGRYYIPQYVIDWMHRFAKVMQIGAAYGRSNQPTLNRCNHLRAMNISDVAKPEQGELWVCPTCQMRFSENPHKVKL